MGDPDLDVLAEQERRLVFEGFDNDTAWALGVQMVTVARERGLPVVVSIERNGQRLFHAALPGTAADNDAWVERKVRVVRRYGRSSYQVGCHFRAEGSTFEEKSRLDPNEYAAHGGAFPLTVKNVGVVGSITVSGLPQADDHAFVVEQIERFLADRP
ncbi:heme-degrading domain-containing protein [Kutzneria sp. CA-103260]|uniref:heme-degrading domain-containing protein n=1 Tax=Kutzneria sp. CA-103260 TaxID=2802641 RepID=UPI001BAD06CD|nr:heme-degrading domain-containing protein [Kutzneria sp. CA-103260]QUQ65250.1 heme-degrading domain-containing protein [Kutzneria sp. CA-103260]